MERIPHIHQVQQAIDRVWQERDWKDPSRVQRVFACYDDEGNLRVIAVLNRSYGDQQITVEDYDVEVVSALTAIADRSLNCRPGDTFVVGDGEGRTKYLMLAKEGNPLPIQHGRRPMTWAEWEQSIQSLRRAQSERQGLLTELSDILATLRHRKTILEADRRQTAATPGMGAEEAWLCERLEKTAGLEDEVLELHQVCASDDAMSSEMMAYFQKNLRSLHTTLQSELDQEQERLGVLREQRKRLDDEKWQRLVSFDQRNQGVLDLGLTLQTTTLDL